MPFSRNLTKLKKYFVMTRCAPSAYFQDSSRNHEIFSTNLNS
ncbi:MAG: hypothetical protein ACD_79C00838G0001, partial [uncultured bacterium]